MPYPQRSTTVHVEQLGAECAIYDWERKEVHALNPTAARVWQLCDGQTSPAQMAATLQAEWGIPDATDLVRLALDRLAKAHLLISPVLRPVASKVVSRREVLKQLAGLGLAAALLPLVRSIAAPGPIAAASPTPSPQPTATTPPPTATSPPPTATSPVPPTATSPPPPTATNTVGPTATNTSVPTATNTSVPAATNTSVPTATNTSVPTATNTSVPTATPTITPTPTITATPTVTPTPTFPPRAPQP